MRGTDYAPSILHTCMKMATGNLYNKKNNTSKVKKLAYCLSLFFVSVCGVWCMRYTWYCVVGVHAHISIHTCGSQSTVSHVVSQ